MLDLMPSLAGWRPAASGERCAVATIITASGSVPRPPGTSMLVSESGEILGSLSGGCVEGAVVASALEVMADGGTRLEAFGFSREDAFAVGLTCGGELEVHIQPLDGSAAGLGALQKFVGGDPERPLALIRRVDGVSGGACPAGPCPAAHWGPPGRRVLRSPRRPPSSWFLIRALLGLRDRRSSRHCWGLDALNLGTESRKEALLAAAAQLEPLLRGGRTGLVRLAPPQGCGVSGGDAHGTDGWDDVARTRDVAGGEPPAASPAAGVWRQRLRARRWCRPRSCSATALRCAMPARRSQRRSVSPPRTRWPLTGRTGISPRKPPPGASTPHGHLRPHPRPQVRHSLAAGSLGA
jgi:hypothetical protein